MWDVQRVVRGQGDGAEGGRRRGLQGKIREVVRSPFSVKLYEQDKVNDLAFHLKCDGNPRRVLSRGRTWLTGCVWLLWMEKGL